MTHVNKVIERLFKEEVYPLIIEGYNLIADTPEANERKIVCGRMLNFLIDPIDKFDHEYELTYRDIPIELMHHKILAKYIRSFGYGVHIVHESPFSNLMRVTLM